MFFFNIQVCCPENVWQIDDSSHPQQKRGNNQGSNSKEDPLKMEKNSFFYQPNYNQPYNFGYPSSSSTGNQYGNQGYPNGNNGYSGSQFGNQGSNNGLAGNQFGNQGLNNPNNRLTNNQFSPGLNTGNNQNGYQVYENDNENGVPKNNAYGNPPYNNAASGLNGNQFGSQGYNNGNSGLPGNQFGSQNRNQGYDNGDNDYDSGDYDAQKTPFWSNRRRGKRPNVQNPYFQPANRQDNSFRGTNLGGQCPVTSFPPDPATGCCGLEATNPDRITGESRDTSF